MTTTVTGIKYRPARQRDTPPLRRLVAGSFGWSSDRASRWENLRNRGEFATGITAWQADELVGYLAYRPIGIQAGSGTIPGAASADLAVVPRMRRRGIGAALMVETYRHLDAAGIAMYVGSVGPTGMFRRLGWGFGSLIKRYQLPGALLGEHLIHETAQRSAPVAVDVEQPEAQQVYSAAVTGRFGPFDRDESWWQTFVLANVEDDQPRLLAGVADVDGPVGAYAVMAPDREALRIVELHATGGQSYRDILRSIAEEAGLRLVRWSAPCDDPLPLAGQRAYRVTGELAVDKMFRVVNLRRALASLDPAGRWQPGERLVIEVVDEQCPWNAGRWRIAAGTQSIRAEPCDAPVDLTLPVSAIPALLGGVAGNGSQQIVVRSPEQGDALNRLALLLRSPAPAYCREEF